MLSTQPVSILVVDDDEFMNEFVVDCLRQEGHAIRSACGVAQARELTAQEVPDLLVCDLRLEGESGLDLIGWFCVTHPLVPVVVMTGYASQEYVHASRELDICAFLTKPFTQSQIKFSVINALAERHNRLERVGTHFAVVSDPTCGITGNSPYIVTLRSRIVSVARGDFPVVVQGPSGSGKELVAKGIHEASSRSGFPMVAINCAAIPEHLQESEFFGHRKGSFTGALADREGIIAAADRSTLFLDEVGELAQSTQAKLLRVLENKEYVPVGETQPRHVNMRVISATNRDLRGMVESGDFREDLYYRLIGDCIETKPLSEHAEDIPLLVNFFLASLEEQKYPREITAEAMACLVKRQWRGNIRQLKHTVMLLAHAAAGTRRINLSAIESVLHEQVNPSGEVGSYKETKATILEQFERDYFARLLAKHQGNLTRAAEEAGVHRPNLIKKLKSLAIDVSGYRDQGGA